MSNILLQLIEEENFWYCYLHRDKCINSDLARRMLKNTQETRARLESEGLI